MHRAFDVLEKAPFLAPDEAVLGGEGEVGAAIRIRLQARAVGLVVGPARERDQAPGDVVRALVRQEAANEIAAAARVDAAPIPGLGDECGTLCRVDRAADEAADLGYGELVSNR